MKHDYTDQDGFDIHSAHKFDKSEKPLNISRKMSENDRHEAITIVGKMMRRKWISISLCFSAPFIGMLFMYLGLTYFYMGVWISLLLSFVIICIPLMSFVLILNNHYYAGGLLLQGSYAILFVNRHGSTTETFWQLTPL